MKNGQHKMKIGHVLFVALMALAGCEAPTQVAMSNVHPKPATRPVASDESQRIKSYYASVQSRLVAQGKLRQEYAPKDAPFSADDLVSDFEKVALYDEYTLGNGGFIEKQTISTLRRWNKPVRIGLYFGPLVTPKQRAIDTRSVSRFAARLAAISGLKIRMSNLKNANYVVMFLNRDEQISLTPKLAETIPQLVPTIVQEIQNSPRNIFCVAYALSDADQPTEYSGVVILIKSEHARIMRNSCIQEEMTQALGLANDGPDIRPSIFNDDEEFATLTRHDEILLKMLYDPRLRVGMTPDHARPLLKQVAEDALKQSRI